MRLGTVIRGGATYAAAVDDRGDWRDLSAAFPNGLRAALGTSTWLTDARRALSDAPSIEVGEYQLAPPIPDPSRVLCAGFNYRAHAWEADRPADPTHPTFFARFPSSLVGSGVPIERPSVSDSLDWEGELAVVIGRGGRHIPASTASDHVAGYTCFGDHSVRDFQMHGTQATAGKNFDRSGSMGPWMLTADEVLDVSALEVVTRVNGVEVQHGHVCDLIFDVSALIAYVSSFTTLAPGDVIATGTPAGIGARRNPPVFLAAGDQVDVEVPGVGVLSNVVIDEVRHAD